MNDFLLYLYIISTPTLVSTIFVTLLVIVLTCAFIGSSTEKEQETSVG